MNFAHNLNEILKILLNKDIKQGIDNIAAYWKIGTSIFNTFDRLYENIKNVEINGPLISKKSTDTKTTQGKNNEYYFILNDSIVTPTIFKDKKVSSAAIHQYNSMICSFSLGANDKFYKNKIDFVTSEGKIILNSQIKNLLKKENRLELVKKVIVDALFTNVKDTRDIAYSILMELLFSNNFNMQLLNTSNRIFNWKKVIGKLNNKTIKHADLTIDLEKIKKDIEKQGTVATYKELISFINSKTTLESFINEIYITYLSKIKGKEIEVEFEAITSQIINMNIKSIIKSERSKFKDEIFENRKQLNLIETKTDYYTDIVDFNDDTSDLICKFNEGEAAHIFDVHKIRNDLLQKNVLDERMIKYISNPNNGLIMKHDYHKSFDRGQWFFDTNGEMVVPVENQHYLFKVLNLKPIKIRQEIFNNEMLEFLRMR